MIMIRRRLIVIVVKIMITIMITMLIMMVTMIIILSGATPRYGGLEASAAFLNPAQGRAQVAVYTIRY